METIPIEEISPQTEPTSPPSPKRARTDCAATENLHWNSGFNSSQLQTSQDAISSLSTNNLQETNGLIKAESGQYHDENPTGLPSDLTPATHVTSESNDVCASVEREGKSFVTETDELSPASNSTPSLSDCKQLEKSLEGENPAVCLQNDGNDGNLGTWTQTQPSLIQAVTFCSHQTADTDFCHSFSQLADAVESDLKTEEAPLRSPTSSSQGVLPLCSNVEADHSQKSDHRIPENISDVETKGQGSKTFVNSSEGLIPCCEFVSGTTTSAENVSFQEHNYVVEAEIPAAVIISQEAAKGDNEADAFCVIDPVIWSEIDEEVERLICNSDGAAGGELSPLVEVCNIEATFPLCSEARTSLDSIPDQMEQVQRDGNKIGTTSNLMQDQTDNESKSSPAFAEDDLTGEICDTARSQLKVAVSPDHMEMPELEYLHGKTDEVEEVAGFIQSHSPKETETYKLRNLESEWQNKQGDCNSYQKEGETQKHGSNLKSIDNKQNNELDEAFGANICITYVTTKGKEQNQKVKVGGEINIDEQETGERMQKQSEFEDDIREESPIQDVSEWAENRLSFYNGEDPEQRLGNFTHDQHMPDVSTFHSIPPMTDAVVPCPSQNALHGVRYFPSAFTPGKDALGRFDTFEKIKLFPDDDDGATELLNTPQEEQEHHVEVAESEINEKTLEDKENTENGFVSSDSSSNEVPNFTPFLEKEPNSRSTNDSPHCSHDELNPQSASSAVPTDSDGPSCDLSTNFDFEMKEQFGRILQELNLFFDISRNEFTKSPSPDLPEPSVGHSTKVLSSPGLECYAHTSTDKAVEDHGLVMCGLDPAVSCPVIRSDGEQEVPLNRNLEQEPLMDTTEKSKESQEVEQKVKVWSPSFMRLPDLEQLSHGPPDLPRRLEPLRTCTRPIRVGLSKRAKTKQLHHAHPYK